VKLTAFPWDPNQLLGTEIVADVAKAAVVVSTVLPSFTWAL
jgi:hypothetical protein